MIQRIQTLWLLLVAILASLTFTFPFFTGITQKLFDGLVDVVPQNSINKLNGLSNIVLLLVTVAIVILALISIFLYKNRKRQRVITFINLVISFGLIALYFYYRYVKYAGGSLALTSLFAFLIPIGLILALRGINTDIELLRSVDRLR